MMLFMIETGFLIQSVSTSLEALELSLRRLRSIRIQTLRAKKKRSGQQAYP